jgi:DNA-binding NarL/FixJ family response regulator
MMAQKTNKIKVAVIEDDKAIQEWLVKSINKHPDLLCTSSYSSGEEALQGIKVFDAEVVVVDIHLPRISGIECMKQLKAVHPHLLFMVCTVFEDDENVFESLKAGASAYILKKTPSTQVTDSILDLYNGGSPMSSQIARKVIESFNPRERKHTKLIEELTVREKQVLDSLAKGLRYKEIAENLNISITTVRTHIQNIYLKLQVTSRTEALNKAYK